jgi:hypothetical protein
MFPLHVCHLTTKPLHVHLLTASPLQFILMFFLLCDIFPNLLFPSLSSFPSWAFSSYFHVQNLHWDSILVILKIRSYSLILLLICHPTLNLTLSSL